jgi:hypothetical protein
MTVSKIMHTIIYINVAMDGMLVKTENKLTN